MNRSEAASEMARATMGWLDMSVFGMMLAVSAIIGCYFACCSGRKNTAKEYLMGGKSMGILPISLSLISRYLFLISIKLLNGKWKLTFILH